MDIRRVNNKKHKRQYKNNYFGNKYGESQQFSVKINRMGDLASEGESNLFFAKWVFEHQFYNINVTY